MIPHKPLKVMFAVQVHASIITPIAFAAHREAIEQHDRIVARGEDPGEFEDRRDAIEIAMLDQKHSSRQ